MSAEIVREVVRQLANRREVYPFPGGTGELVIAPPTTLDRVRQLERRQLDLEAVCYGGLALLVFIFIISRR